MNEISAGLGHNQGPPFDPAIIEALRADAKALVEPHRDWLAKGILESEEQAALAADHITGLRKLKKRATEAKAEAKRPHDDAGKAVLAAFSPVIDGIEKMIATALNLQTDFLNRKQAEQDRERREAEAEAARKREEAEAAAREAAASGDAIAEAAAINAAKAAEKEEKQAAKVDVARVGSATGGGRTIAMRSQKTAQIKNARLLALHFVNHPDLIAALQSLANRHVRAADWDGVDLPGTETITERKAA